MPYKQALNKTSLKALDGVEDVAGFRFSIIFRIGKRNFTSSFPKFVRVSGLYSPMPTGTGMEYFDSDTHMRFGFMHVSFSRTGH